MKYLLLSAVLGCGFLMAPAPAQSDTSALHSQTLLKEEQSWDGTQFVSYPTGKPEVTMMRLEIPAHKALPWHTHAMPSAEYVLQGSITIEERDSGKKKTFHQGEAFAESINIVHRGVAGDQPTILLLTYATVKGLPVSKSVPGEKSEY